ncbi:MAG TPA: FAD-dependent oxidoreductase [Pseudonocardiaceae bacterium]|nr:FAD-dependent oxidoreductase [Pseudonocardiaceae bacterium]
MRSRHDIVVIGGGIAGVSVAYELAACRRVILLETETSLATHATGRSAAMYVPGHGGPRVRALINASGPRFAHLVEELGAPALLRPRPVLWAAFDEDGERALRTELVQRSDEPDAPVELSLKEAVARCPVLRRDVLHAAAVTEAACDLDAMALHQAYVRGLRRRGGCVRVAAPVTGLDPVSGGWRVRCGTGDALFAADVVDAAGAWADVIAGLAGVRRVGLRPLRRTIVVARVPDPARLCTPDPGAPPRMTAAPSAANAGADSIPEPPWPAKKWKPGCCGQAPTTGARSATNERSPAQLECTERSPSPVTASTRSRASATSSGSGRASPGAIGVSSPGESNRLLSPSTLK